VNLDPVVGTEIRKTGPAVVVSNDSCNRYGTRLVVLPITGNVDSLFPGEARVEVKGKLGRALGDQIRSIGSPGIGASHFRTAHRTIALSSRRTADTYLE
jgi:mRNA-degrading endonuclease toxin of MazEF toxin-antitoxin module